MKIKRRIQPATLYLLFAHVVGLAPSGCGDGEAREPGNGDVPAALLQIEGDAEDAYDRALAGDVATVRTDAARLDGAWTGFRPQAIADGAPEAVVVAVDRAIADLGQAAGGAGGVVVVARAANSVSASMDELFGLYRPVIPPAVVELDYLGRELSLDGRAVDAAAATRDLASMRSVWSELKPGVVAAGGNQVAAAYDTSLDDAQAAIEAGDGVALTARADAGLELVDSMERLFTGG